MTLPYDIDLIDNENGECFIPDILSTQFINITVEDIINNIAKGYNDIAVLDYGCGTGYIGIAIAKNIKDASSVTLYDIDEKAIDMARSNMYYNNLNGLNITNDSSNIDDKFTNIIFYQPFLTVKKYNEKVKQGQDLEPKDAYVINKNMYKNFAKFCSEHISKDHFLILLSYIDEDTAIKVKKEFLVFLPSCKIETLKYNQCKFITIRNS